MQTGRLIVLSLALVFSTVSFTVAQDNWLEAECSTLGTSWEEINDAYASGGKSVRISQVSHLFSPPENPQEHMRFTLDVDEPGDYTISSRVKALDENSDAFWVRVNNKNWMKWDNIKKVDSAASGGSNPPPNPGYLPAVPGGAGYGMQTAAGRGGDIIRVTNLNQNGPGSLEAALQASGPRTIVFEVAGLIHLNMEMIRNGNVTIAGQTAPAPGITIRGSMWIGDSDVLIQHVTLRHCEACAWHPDVISIGETWEGKPVKNVVLDHVSLSWGKDETIEIVNNATDVTLRNVMITEGLRRGALNSYASLFDTPGNLTVVGSYFAHNDQRMVASRMSNFLFVNNVCYDRGMRFTQLSNRGHSWSSQNTIIGNVYVEGPSLYNNPTRERPIHVDAADLKPQTRIYVEDNYWSEDPLTDPWDLVSAAGTQYQASTPSNLLQGIVPITGEQEITDYVLANAGSRPAEREPVAQRMIDQFNNREGQLFDDEAAVGGFPNLTPTYRPLTLPQNPNADENGDGYTNLENWLHSLAAAVEGPGATGGGTPTPTYLWDEVRAPGANDPATFQLDEGINTIDIAVCEPGTSLDKIYVTRTSNVPTGNGGSATNCAPGTLTVPVRINSGGLGYLDQEGMIYEPDNFHLGGPVVHEDLVSIDNTQDAELYQTSRQGSRLVYNIPLPNGAYDVTLHFAELEHSRVGQRVFDINLQGGSPEASRFDIFANAGSDNTAFTETFTYVLVSNGILEIDLQASTGLASISAIEITQPDCGLNLSWFNEDIGGVAIPGNACDSSRNGTFSINASGSDIWNTGDEFHFVYQPFRGDGEVIARITNVQNTNPWAKAGVMMRNALTPDSRNAMMYISAELRWSFQRRINDGALTVSSTSQPGEVRLPYWVKLERRGNEFRGYYSDNGVDWVLVNMERIMMDTDIYVGLAVTSHDNTVSNTSEMDNVFLASESSSNTFPIELAGFNAQPLPRDGVVKLSWATASEQDNDFFTIERSRDGIEFESVKDVPSQGNSSTRQEYQTIDISPITDQTSFYRLKQTDFDGSFTYSQTVAVNFGEGNSNLLRVQPNAVREGESIDVQFQLEGDTDTRVELRNMMGQTLFKVAEPADNQVRKIKIPTSGLAPGYYTVMIYNNQGGETEKVVVTN